MNKINQSAIFQLADEIGWEAAGNGIQRQVYGYSQELMLVKVRFIKGAVGDLHSHPHVQSSFVESGVFELTIGDEKKVLQKGDGYFVPAHVLHGCVCLEEGILIDCFSPYREDFIQ